MPLRVLLLALAVALGVASGWQLREAKRLRAEAERLDLQALTAPLDGITFPPDPARAAAARARADGLKEQGRAALRRANDAEVLGSALLLPAAFLLVLGIIVRPPPREGPGAADAPDAFVSYNHKDIDEARAVRDALQAAGLRAALIDRILDVSGDDELRRILREQILAARAIVVLLTPRSLRSDWVGFERTVGETRLRTIVYLYHGVSLFTALWRTHFLPRAETFRVHAALTARRRYVRYDAAGGDWLTLLRGHVAATRWRGADRLVLGQLLLSYGSLDQMAANALFNAVENRALLRPASKVWRAMRGLGRAYQLLALCSVPLVLWALGLVLMVMFL